MNDMNIELDDDHPKVKKWKGLLDLPLTESEMIMSEKLPFQVARHMDSAGSQ